jgi:hypothetical protein
MNVLVVTGCLLVPPASVSGQVVASEVGNESPGFTSYYLQRRAGERSELGERVASGNPSCRPQGLASVARYSAEERCNREHPVDVLTIVQDGANESYFRENLEEDDDCFL